MGLPVPLPYSYLSLGPDDPLPTAHNSQHRSIAAIAMALFNSLVTAKYLSAYLIGQYSVGGNSPFFIWGPVSLLLLTDLLALSISICDPNRIPHYMKMLVPFLRRGVIALTLAWFGSFVALAASNLFAIVAIFLFGIITAMHYLPWHFLSKALALDEWA